MSVVFVDPGAEVVLLHSYQDAAPSHTARSTISSNERMSPSLSQTCDPSCPDLNPWIMPLEGPAAASLPRQEVRHRYRLNQLAMALEWHTGAHHHSASFFKASVNGDVVCSVSWIRMADIVNTSSLTACTMKLLLLRTLC